MDEEETTDGPIEDLDQEFERLKEYLKIVDLMIKNNFPDDETR